MQNKYSATAGRDCVRRARTLLALALIGLAGCAGVPQTSPPAILVSERIEAYQDVATALAGRLPGASVVHLEGDQRRVRSAIDNLRQNRDAPVIAIGALATDAALRLRDRRIVYCQDFGSQRASPASGAIRGVAVMPPARKQLQAWRMVDPRLRRITLLSGSGMEGFARSALTAARALGIELDHVVVQSDRELAYVVKRVAPDVQGVWFVPDNRILSVSALRETLAYNLRYGRQSLVFSRQLLAFGGMISVESDPDDIAERVVEQLRAKENMGPLLAPLQRARARVNVRIAAQLGLRVPAAMRGAPYVF